MCMFNCIRVADIQAVKILPVPACWQALSCIDGWGSRSYWAASMKREDGFCHLGFMVSLT